MILPPPHQRKAPPATTGSAKPIEFTPSNLPGQGGSVNPDSETIALLQETVWLLTGIYNLLNEIKQRMP